MKKIILVSILLIVLIAIFYPKESGEYTGDSGPWRGWQTYCTCIGYKQSIKIGKGLNFTCYGIPYNCKNGYFANTADPNSFIEEGFFD